MKYPAPPREPLTEILHGVAVSDPFRRLENPDDPATIAWVEQENDLTRRLLDDPIRYALVERLRQLHRYPRASVAAVRGPRLFFTENDGTRDQAILYTAGARGWGLGASDDKRVLVDPNAIEAGGTTAITEFEPDDEGARVVYALSRGGSDRQELAVRDVESNLDLPDRIQWVKFASVAWVDDGFFYTRFPEPGSVPARDEQYFCQVWRHRLGDPQEADRLVHHRPDAPEVVFDIDVTSDGRHLVITSRRGASDNAEIHVVRLKADTTEARALVTGFTDGWHFIDGAANALYFLTDAGALMGRIVRVELDDPTLSPREIVPETRDKIAEAAIVSGRLVVSSLHNASSRLQRFELDGSGAREIALPGLGTVLGIGGRWHDTRCVVTFTSFTTPPQILACDLDACRVEEVDRARLPIDPSSYVAEQVWYPSKDGTPVSMFLVSKRSSGEGLEACRGAVLLTGYGGFNISLTPAFDPSDFVWLDAGGVIAVANLRGGGEYGEAWHRAGMLDSKQNVFDDFIAAAEWLRASGRANRVVIEGGSNGGLLVGAALVQRPELYDAVICRVPVADMLRYHLFTVGRFWIPEYGSADEVTQFAFLLRYSPYHNVVDGVAYPPTIVMTADTDDRVAPGMAKKFAARLQEAVSDSGGPILLRVETRAGHGAGKPMTKQIEEQADMCAFLFNYVTRTSASEQQRR